MNRLRTIATVGAIVAGMALTGLAFADTHGAANIMSRQQLQINHNNMVRARGKVAAVDDSSVTLALWGINVRANVNADTKVKGSLNGLRDNTSILSNIKVGDDVEVRGLLLSSSTGLVLNAQSINDFSFRMGKRATPSPSPSATPSVTSSVSPTPTESASPSVSPRPETPEPTPSMTPSPTPSQSNRENNSNAQAIYRFMIRASH